MARLSSNESKLRLRLVGALVIASVQCTATARAESNSDELIASGIRLRRDHRDAEALTEFQRAYALEPSPRALAQIALAEQALSSWVRAEVDLKNALASRTDAWIATNATRLNQALSAIGEHLATLTVIGAPGAHLFLNGVELGTLPLGARRVPAGSVTVLLRLEPDLETSHLLELPASAVIIDRVEFPPVTPAPPPPPSNPQASHTQNPSATSKVATARAATATADSTQRGLAWCALGGASSALVLAIVAEVVRQTQVARYNDDQRCSYGNRSRDERCGVYRGRAEIARGLATGGYVGAGVLAAASALLFLTLPARKSDAVRPRDARFEPWLVLDAREARFGWQGSW